jgi:hypothetical protein
MPSPHRRIFTPDFIVTLRGLIGIHQSIYPQTPPQGIYFEGAGRGGFLADQETCNNH